jgi:hypothetical protein
MMFPISSPEACELSCMILPVRFSGSGIDLRTMFLAPSSVISSHLSAISSITSSIAGEDFCVAFAVVVALVVLPDTLGVSFGPGAVVELKLGAILASPLSCLLTQSRFVSQIPSVFVCGQGSIVGHCRQTIKFSQLAEGRRPCQEIWATEYGVDGSVHELYGIMTEGRKVIPGTLPQP